MFVLNTYRRNRCPGMISAMVTMTAVMSSCQGQRSPWKKRGMADNAEAMMPQMVFGRKWRMMPVMKHPIPQSSP